MSRKKEITDDLGKRVYEATSGYKMLQNHLYRVWTPQIHQSTVRQSVY